MEKKVFRFRDIEFWAEGGRVFVQNLSKADDPTKTVFEVVRSVEPKEFMKRALAIYALHQDDKPSERFNVRKLVDEAEQVVKNALMQADKLQTNRVQIVMPRSDTPQLIVPTRKYTLKKEKDEKILLDGYTIEENFNECA